MENVFDALCSGLTEPANKTLFLGDEGVELMVIMMKCASSLFLKLQGSIRGTCKLIELVL